MGPSSAPPSATRSGSELRCVYTGHTVVDAHARLSSVAPDAVRGWLEDAVAGFDAPCPPRLVRVAPDFSEGETIPSLDAARGFLREMVAPGVLPWELSQDGSQQIAHALASALAARGFNAHALFAMGRLAPRDVDGRFLRRSGLLSDGRSTSEPAEARRWTYHVAAAVVVRVDGRAGPSFPCADDRAQRCAWRVLDPMIRLGRARATTDEDLGLLSVSSWLRALRPADEASGSGISLELARHEQMLPRALHRSAFDPLVIGEGDGCGLDPEGLRARAAARRGARDATVTASYRAILSIEADSQGRGALELEGVDEPLALADRSIAEGLRLAMAASAPVTVSYDGATATVRAWRPERGMAPTPCLRATLASGEQTP
jgi:hypothetical protein